MCCTQVNLSFFRTASLIFDRYTLLPLDEILAKRATCHAKYTPAHGCAEVPRARRSTKREQNAPPGHLCAIG
jgi:hypothetical protein